MLSGSYKLVENVSTNIILEIETHEWWTIIPVCGFREHVLHAKAMEYG